MLFKFKMSFFNPLHGIIETKSSPHARTLRTGFWQKCKDVFFVFAGDFPVSLFKKPVPTQRDHMGLFDWLIPFIPIPLILTTILSHLRWSKYKAISIIGHILYAIIGLPLLAIRYLASAVLSAPIILFVIPIVHLISQYAAGGINLKKRARSFNLTIEDQQNESQTLEQILDGNGQNIIDFDEINIANGSDAQPNLIVVNTIHGRFSQSIFEVPQADNEALHALIKLNIGEITVKLEKSADKGNNSARELLRQIFPSS